MKSFPSSLNRGNKNIIMNHASKSLLDSVLSSFKTAFQDAFKSGMKSVKFGANTKDSPVYTEGLIFDDSINKKVLLDALDFTRFRNYRGDPFVRGSVPISKAKEYSPVETGYPSFITIENPYNFNSDAINIMNKYNGRSFEVRNYDNLGEEDKSKKTNKKDNNTQNSEQASTEQAKDKIGFFGSNTWGKRSLFNPYNAIHVLGMTENVPLLYGYDGKEDGFTNDLDIPNAAYDLSDCSISRLVKLSLQRQSILGQARYKYADFAFCKDLGMPNNRLITLRRFTVPVGDYIFRAAASGNTPYDNVETDTLEAFTTPGDVGRMCCYFDTDDNKLEEILKYSFAGSWKEMKAEIEQQQSQENDHVTPLGSIVNAMNPSMNSMIGQGFSGSQNHLLGRLGRSWFGWSDQQYYSEKSLTNYDNHKIYTPRNTLQSMHKYEGNLEFKHEFTLVFSYKLRSYSNINPKSAMLDLLANIVATTYSRGKFWGGRSDIIGAQPNKSGWKKATDLVNKGFDTVGGLIGALVDGKFDLSSVLGSLTNLGSKILDKIKSIGVKDVVDFAKDTKIGEGVKGLLKNQLGRPEIYAFQTLLDGSNTGFWHVTIGNPLNPIASIGNLIVTDTQIQHFGPLGIDDFPTELKVTVSLKHARPRDAVAIERMYTKGVSAIYLPIVSSNYREEKGSLFMATEGIAGVDKDLDYYGLQDTTGSLDYYGDFATERIKRNAEELS